MEKIKIIIYIYEICLFNLIIIIYMKKKKKKKKRV